MSVSEDIVVWSRDRYEISTDKDRLDFEQLHNFLCYESTWAQGRTMEEVRKTIEHSLAFGVYDTDTGEMCGSARVVTDYVTFAWLADVFIIDKYKGRGLGLWLTECVVDHPALKDLKRWLLATETANPLYKRVGFDDVPTNRYMVRLRALKMNNI